jgi:hypothetical protein
LRFFAWALAWIAAALCGTWAFGALYFDLPIVSLRTPAAVAFALVLLGVVIGLRGRLLKLASVFGGFTLVLCWWLTLKPSNDRPWQADVARTASAEINGDEVVVHNVRDCDYRTEGDFTPHWETRTIRLSQITGMDVAIKDNGKRGIDRSNHVELALLLRCRKKLMSFALCSGLFNKKSKLGSYRLSLSVTVMVLALYQ